MKLNLKKRKKKKKVINVVLPVEDELGFLDGEDEFADVLEVSEE